MRGDRLGGPSEGMTVESVAFDTTLGVGVGGDTSEFMEYWHSQTNHDPRLNGVARTTRPWT